MQRHGDRSGGCNGLFFFFKLQSNILFSVIKVFKRKGLNVSLDLELSRFASSGKQFVLWNSKSWFSEVLTYKFNLFPLGDFEDLTCDIFKGSPTVLKNFRRTHLGYSKLQ